jgi:hypothetical protein
MPRPEPTNIIEYNARFLENQRITGWGPGVEMHMPCPFCTAPDFMVFQIMQTEQAFAKGAVCGSCGRGMKMIVRRGPGEVRYRPVQTEGPDAPAWMDPQIPRLAPPLDVEPEGV